MQQMEQQTGRGEPVLSTFSVIRGLRPSTTCSNSHSSGAEHLIQTYVGVTTKVRVEESGTLERSQDKAKRVLDLRPRE